MDGLCTGAGWREDGKLHLELRDGEQKTTPELTEGSQLAFEVLGSRTCIGSRPPDSESLIPCPDHVTGIPGNQCPQCFSSTNILSCHLCDGERCKNPARRSACVQPQNHGCYLASFGPGLMKVGVALWERRYQRLMEQGAKAGIIIARDDGQMIRRVESQIRRRGGVPDRVQPREKLYALTQAASVDDLRAELKQLAGELRPRISGRWLDQFEAIDLPTLPQLDQIPRLLSVSDGMRLRGELAAVCGQTLIIDSDTAEQVALEVTSLVGYELRSLQADEQGAGQLALQFA